MLPPLSNESTAQGRALPRQTHASQDLREWGLRAEKLGNSVATLLVVLFGQFLCTLRIADPFIGKIEKTR